ncbi:MAG: protein-L-isoaspartate O-methyltransferase [Halobacteriaceae archaeon]
MDDAVLREDMVDSLAHESKGVLRSEQVALAMREVPRKPFVGDGDRAYVDQATRHRGARVLSPSTAARLLSALRAEPGDEVLVVGAGVGYTVAVLAEIAGARRVHAVDIDRKTVLDARRNLAEAGYEAALVDCRDGANGLPEYAPFDRILVEAAGAEPPAALVEQLAPGGRLVMPLGLPEQTLTAVEGGGAVGEFGPTEFDPLLVEGEQHSGVERNRTAREERERAAREAQSRTGWEQDWIDWD